MSDPTPHQTTREVHRVQVLCRACGEARLIRFLVLGPQPLANANLRDLSEVVGEQTFPLDVYFCESCSLVQLADVIDPETLFRHYIYVTGTSETTIYMEKPETILSMAERVSIYLTAAPEMTPSMAATAPTC